MPGSHSKAPESIRTFLCIDVPDPIRAEIGKLQSLLRRESADVGWVNPFNIHLTLKFLGAVLTTRIDAIIAAARRAAAATDSFQIRVCDVGCFPSKRSPRVLWVGLAEVPEGLKLLQEAVEEQMESQGFSRDKRPFAPHLTIGRIRSNRNAQNVAQALIEHGFRSDAFNATELTVMKSDLRPTGAIYTALARIPLTHINVAKQSSTADRDSETS